MNISSLGKRTDLKLGEVYSFFISYNFTISLTLSVLLRDSENDKQGETYSSNFCLSLLVFCTLSPIET